MRVAIITFPGSNCDYDCYKAINDVLGAEAYYRWHRESELGECDAVILPGGFSYGDYVMSGRIASLVTEQKIGATLGEFRDNGGFILGICNGFQILTQLGLLPPGSLVENASGRFQCQWVRLKNLAPTSPYLAHLPEEFEFPIAHAEGRFVTREASGAADYVENGAAALTSTRSTAVSKASPVSRMKAAASSA